MSRQVGQVAAPQEQRAQEPSGIVCVVCAPDPLAFAGLPQNVVASSPRTM